MTSSGCAPSGKGSPSAQEETAAAKPAGECGRVSVKPVKDPPMRKGEDPLAVLGRYRAALHVANKQGTEGAQCADSAAQRAGGK